MGRRGWLAAAGVVVVAGCAVAGGAAWRGHADEGQSPGPVPVASSPRPTAGKVDPAPKAAVDAILRRRATAVLRKNEAQFLADVNPRNQKLLAAQKVLFGNLVQFGFAKLSYVPGQPQVKQPLVDQYGPSTYLVSVAMRYQISGIDEQPVETALGYLFVQRGGRYVLIDDTQLDVGLPRGSHREA